MRWTKEQRDKGIESLYQLAWGHEEPQFRPHIENWKKNITHPYVIALVSERVIDLACQRNELLEALKAVAELLPSRDTVDALMPDCGLGRRHYPLSRGLLDSDVVRILDTIAKAEGTL